MNGIVVERLAFFLLERTGSVCGKWTGRMRSTEQMALFGRNLCGRREIQIDGSRETIKAKMTVCFGTDCEIQNWTWREIAI
ncbi:MAG: hypothetical protein ACYDH9_09600 [Limisphaerales bacterium]